MDILCCSSECLLRIEDGEEVCRRCPKATLAGKAERTGGLVVAGVAVATSCQVVLPVFGSLFLIVGAVLTIASYRGPEAGEEIEEYVERVKVTSNLRVLGPACLAVGGAMLILGITLCLLSRRAHTLPYHCPIHGHFYPITPVNKIFSRRSSTAWCSGGAVEDRPSTPQCPHSSRSSVSNPSPLPLPSHSQSFSGSLMPGSIAENIGSMRSLSVSYDVASFPHSRSPSPQGEEDGGVARQVKSASDSEIPPQ